MPMSRHGMMVMATAMFMSLGINFTAFNSNVDVELWGDLSES
jgi:hypothetical protein